MMYICINFIVHVRFKLPPLSFCKGIFEFFFTKRS